MVKSLCESAARTGGFRAGFVLWCSQIRCAFTRALAPANGATAHSQLESSRHDLRFAQPDPDTLIQSQINSLPGFGNARSSVRGAEQQPGDGARSRNVQEEREAKPTRQGALDTSRTNTMTCSAGSLASPMTPTRVATSQPRYGDDGLRKGSAEPAAKP